MTTTLPPAAAATRSDALPASADRLPGAAPSQGLARASTLIAATTAAARIAGFVRVTVFGRVFGAGVLGDTYLAANTVPNVIYDSVAGGALAGLVVPVLAGAAAARDIAALRRTVSALLTWTVLVLTPPAFLCAVFSHQILGLLIAADAPDRAARVHLGAGMLIVFAPQVVLYGIGVVCSGTLQAHRRFLAPALAPLLSSLVVIACYLLFAGVHPGLAVSTVGRAGALVLSVGTTLGVVALTLTVAVPTLRLRLGLRPTLRFPAGVAVAVRRLAAAGMAGLLAQQASLLVALRLASSQEGAQTIFLQATAVFVVPWAVLAVPVATTAFPALSAAMSAPAVNAARYDRILSRALRAVLLGGLVGAGLLVALAGPVARLVLGVRAGTSLSGGSDLRDAIVSFAPGLPGFAVLAVTMRALYARRASRRAGAAVVAGWATVIVTDVALVAKFPSAPAASLLGAGNSAGMTVAGALLVVALISVGAGAAFARIGRTLAVGGLAGTVAAVTGLAVAAWTSSGNVLMSLAATGGAGLAAAGATVGMADRGALPARLREMVR